MPRAAEANPRLFCFKDQLLTDEVMFDLADGLGPVGLVIGKSADFVLGRGDDLVPQHDLAGRLRGEVEVDRAGIDPATLGRSVLRMHRADGMERPGRGAAGGMIPRNDNSRRGDPCGFFGACISLRRERPTTLTLSGQPDS